jgi:high-affinity iron transporter
MFALILAAALTAHDHAERAMGMLGYVAGDYLSAVDGGGRLLDPEELSEQELFARQASEDLSAAGAPDLARDSSSLAERISARAPAPQVILAARQIEARIEQRFQLALLPPREPRVARALYLQACAACHGNAGVPSRLDLSTAVPDLSSKSQVATLSPRRIFSAITYGVPGTAMPSFSDAIPAEQRWDLAWTVLALSHADARERRRGEQLLSRFPRRPDYLQLAVRTDEQLRHVLAAMQLSERDREAVLTACREAR